MAYLIRSPMTNSSRKSEGHPDKCPLCGSNVHIDPPPLFGDMPCPHCGRLLWYVCSYPETRIFEYEAAATARTRLIDRVAQRLGIEREQVSGDPRRLECFVSDPLDLVELVMDIEDGGLLGE